MKIEVIVSGLNMGKIGDYSFYMDKNAYKKISSTITASFGSFKPIKGQKVLTDSGGYEEKLSLNGVLIVQPLDQLETLKDMVKARKVLRFTTVQDDIEVVINSINTVKEYFTDSGEHTVASYNLQLEVVYDEIQ